MYRVRRFIYAECARCRQKKEAYTVFMCSLTQAANNICCYDFEPMSLSTFSLPVLLSARYVASNATTFGVIIAH